MTSDGRKVIAYLSASSGDWGGASRVLFTNLKLLDRGRYRPLVLLPAEGPVLDELERTGTDYHLWGDAREPRGALRYAADIVACARFFRRRRVRLLHINHASYWRPAEVIAAKLLRIPVITHYHVVVDEPGPYVRFSSAIAAVSRYTAEHSRPENVPKKIIHNAVELARYDNARSLRGELGLAADDVVVSFIGQVREIKGVDLFLRLAHAIPDARVKFLIVGECRDPEKYEGSYTVERLEREIGGDARIRYVGYRSDVENLYRTSDLIVMPSLWEEPFGLINIEAGAARRPIVATRVGGIPEVVEHGENGFLVDRGDLEALVAHTRSLADDESLRRRVGDRGRSLVEERFTQAPVRALEALYEELTA